VIIFPDGFRRGLRRISSQMRGGSTAIETRCPWRSALRMSRLAEKLGIGAAQRFGIMPALRVRGRYPGPASYGAIIDGLETLNQSARRDDLARSPARLPVCRDSHSLDDSTATEFATTARAQRSEGPKHASAASSNGLVLGSRRKYCRSVFRLQAGCGEKFVIARIAALVPLEHAV
jgi:hypothetical protein